DQLANLLLGTVDPDQVGFGGRSRRWACEDSAQGDPAQSVDQVLERERVLSRRRFHCQRSHGASFHLPSSRFWTRFRPTPSPSRNDGGSRAFHASKPSSTLTATSVRRSSRPRCRKVRRVWSSPIWPWFALTRSRGPLSILKPSLCDLGDDRAH